MVDKSGKGIRDWGSLVQLILFTGSLFYGVFVWSLPSPFNAIAFCVGEFTIGVVMIGLGSLIMRAGMITKQHDSAVAVISGQNASPQQLEIPPLRIFLIRNTFALIGIVSAWAILWGGAFAIIFAAGKAIREQPNEETRLILIPLFIPPFVIAVFGSFLAFNIVGAVVDHYIYKNVAIQHMLYRDDPDPLNVGRLLKAVGSILLVAVVYGILYGGLFIVKVGLNNIDLDAALPKGTAYFCLVGMLILPFLGLWWLGRLTNIDRQNQRVLTAVEKTYGQNSEEYREFQKLSEQQANSFEQQAHAQIGQRFFRMVGLFLAALMVLALLLNLFNVPESARESITVIFLLLALIGFFVGLSRSGNWLNLKVPEEAQKLDDTLQKGDYKTSQHYADLLTQKMPAVEANLFAAYPYWLGGDTAKGKALAQEGLAAALARDEEHRNPQQIARYLWYIGAMQIAEDDYAGALENLNRATHYNAKDLGIYGNLAEALLTANRDPEKALEYINTQFALNEQLPANERAPLNTGRLIKAWALVRLGDHKSADLLIQEAFERVNRSNIPTMGEMNYLAAHIALARRDTGSAQEYVNRVLAVDPDGLYAQLARKLL